MGDSIALHNGVGRIKESKQAVNRIECTTIMKKIVADRKMPQESEEDVSSFHIRPLALLWIGCTALIFQVLVGWFYYKDASNPTIGTCVPPIVPVLHYIHIHSSRCQMSFFFSRGRIFESHPLFDHDCASLSCYPWCSHHWELVLNWELLVLAFPNQSLTTMRVRVVIQVLHKLFKSTQ